MPPFHILTPLFFSNLLSYQELAPAILRLAVAVTFFYLAYWHFKNKKEAAREISIFSHEVAIWALGVYILVEVAVALALFFGFLTQIAAIIGFLLCLKVLFFKRSMHAFVPLSRSTYILMGAMCLSLILTGAGIFFAVDLPL